MKYLHILLACACEPWALQREKLGAVLGFLQFKALGGELSAEDVQARITQTQERQVAKSQGSVAVLPVYGVLGQKMNLLDEISGGTSTEGLAQQFRGLLADDKVKAIVLDFHSPGGMVQGTEELSKEIFDSRGIKPIIAQVNSLACSAAYWLACSADEIVVNPSGQAGSIGIYSIHEDISKLLEKEGIKPTLITAGKFKAEGNEFEPLGEEARAQIQKGVDESNAIFVKAVARGRNVSQATVNDDFGQGRYFGAAELVKRGMVDRVATMAETLERFGIQLNPVASRARAAMAQRAERAELFISKLEAGDQPSRRELEHGLKGLVGLSNSEAERAAEALLKVRPQGDLEPATGKAAVRNLAEIRRLADAILSS